MKNDDYAARQETARRVRAVLVERFPLCFIGRRTVKRPLKIGIRADIAVRCPDIEWNDLGLALADYMLGATYHRGFFAEGVTQRVDLDGGAAGEITEADRENAHRRLRALAIGVEKRTAGNQRKRDEAAIAGEPREETE